MPSTPYLYLYTTPHDPPNWRLGTQIYHAIGRMLECLLDTAETGTAILILSIVALSLWKRELWILPILGLVSCFLHDWALVFTLVFEVSFIVLALAGMVNFVLWKLFLKGVWKRVCSGGWDAGFFVLRVLGRIIEGVVGWSCWRKLGMGISRLLGWVGYARFWIARLPELRGVSWKKCVSESWILVWPRILISYFGRKPHKAREGDYEEDLEVPTDAPEPAIAPVTPIAIRSMHCTGRTHTDHVNPYSPSPLSRDLLLPESYPLPTTTAPDTPTAQQLRDEDPFKTPAPLRAGDPGFLDAYPSPEGGSEWQRSEKSSVEKEKEKWKFAKTLESKAPKAPVRTFKPSPGSEPGFLDAYPYPLSMPRKWLEDDAKRNAESGGSGGSDNSNEENEHHENHSDKPVMTHANGMGTAEGDADANKHENDSDTASSSSEGSQKTIELCSDDEAIETTEIAVTGSGAELSQNYFKLLKVADSNRQDSMGSSASAEGDGAGAESKAHSEKVQTARETAGKRDHRQDTIEPTAAVSSNIGVTWWVEASTHAAPTLRQHISSPATRQAEGHPEDDEDSSRVSRG